MANPWLTGMPWANGNYPSFPGKPWSLQPMCIAPGFNYFVPTLAYAPTATELNYMFNQRDKAIQYNAAAVGNYNLVAVTQYTPGTPAAWTSAAFVAGSAVAVSGALACVAGDVFEVTATGDLQPGGPAAGYPLIQTGTIQLASKEGAGAFTQFGSLMTASQYMTSAATSYGFPGTCVGTHVISGGVVLWTLGVNGFASGGIGGGGPQVVLGLPGFVVKQWRPNP